VLPGDVGCGEDDRMPRADAGDVSIHYETLGLPDDPPLLLVAGLGNQLIFWPDELCWSLVDRGFFVVRFDNRDCGLSTILPEGSEYRLSDMVGDAIAVLDALSVERANVVGHSLGGMIAQAIAIEHPGRTATLTSISSSTGNFAYGQPTHEALAAIGEPGPTTIDEAIDFAVASRRIWASPSWFDEQQARASFEAAFARAFHPGASMRQLAAILASGDREHALASLDVPTLVVHGTLDPLIAPDGGERTAAVIPGAELLMIEGLGHDLPVQVWPQIVSAITALVARSNA
jgi:pimeloyl-ACP methyl ester carboxylesterase